ncbi:MAG: class I SAM-dependent methyltransferase [Alphaproteobacteria bacterium]|nr:class I SAM-dependent methyltransferase [Alphaproteobacteria bacterium]
MSAEERANSVNGAMLGGSRTEANYDQLPYPSLPFSYTQPSQMAAMAQIFGLEAPRIANTRVLELGCAKGGNLIPLAMRFPDTYFLGIDLSQRHVEEGSKRVAELGLKNIAIRHGDLTRASFDKHEFEYIICHGVFSWVPKTAQDAILRICGESLSPNGVAAISYNVLPGWHMRQIIRDICLFHAGTTGTPDERVAKARRALTEIAEPLGGASPYATLLRNEAQKMTKAASAYILGEFLAENNTPCYFNEFASRAGAAGLAYLCDGEVSTALPEYLYPSVEQQIRAMAGDDPLSLQQYSDLFSGRPFRRSLLVRAERLARTPSSIDFAQLRGLHFSANLKPDVANSAKGKLSFTDAKSGTISATDAVIAAMLARLAAAFPATLTLDEVTGGVDAPPVIERALKLLLGLLGREQAHAFVQPLHVGRGETGSPQVWALARLEAATKQPWVTAQHHVAVKMPPAVGFLAARMDGTRSRQDLTNDLSAAIASGDLRQGGERVQLSPADAEVQVNTAINYMARQGLLLA